MCTNRLIVLGLCGLVWAFSTAVQAQTVTSDAAYWTRFFLRKELGQNYALQGEIDNRRRLSNNTQVQFITHWRLHRRWGKHWDLGLGGAYSNVRGRGEVRPYADVLCTLFPDARLRISQRLRVEKRWFFEPANTEWRGRYRLQLEYVLRPQWRLRASNEAMLHQSVFDQNRVYGAVEWRFSEGWAAELGYLHLLQRRSSEALVEWDIVRGTLYCNL